MKTYEEVLEILLTVLERRLKYPPNTHAYRVAHTLDTADKVVATFKHKSFNYYATFIPRSSARKYHVSSYTFYRKPIEDVLP